MLKLAVVDFDENNKQLRKFGAFIYIHRARVRICVRPGPRAVLRKARP